MTRICMKKHSIDAINEFFSFFIQEMYLLAYEEFHRPQYLEAFNKTFHLKLPFQNTLQFDSKVFSVFILCVISSKFFYNIIILYGVIYSRESTSANYSN